jgi:hypothetical protein
VSSQPRKKNLALHVDMIKELMSYPKFKSVKVINKPTRPGSIHREVNYIYIYILFLIPLVDPLTLTYVFIIV